MKLEILSLGAAIKFNPEVKTHPIRIDSPWDFFSHLEKLDTSENYVRHGDKSWYSFDDTWPVGFDEYKNKTKFNEVNRNILLQAMCPIKDGDFELEKARKILSSIGSHFGREVLFNHDIARKIYTDFEEYKNEVEQVMIHCSRGENRSPAVGIAMNETYGWGIKGLKEKFPHYRRYVYDIMKEVGKEFR